MNLIKKIFKNLFGKKAKIVEMKESEKINVSLINVEEPKEIAKIIPLFNKEQEFEDLEERHGEYLLNSKSPVELMQSRIGNTDKENINTVLSSRSDKFFQEAPEVHIGTDADFVEHTEEILLLEKYMKIPVDMDENELNNLETQIEQDILADN